MWTNAQRQKYNKPRVNTPERAAAKHAYDAARYDAVAEKKRAQARAWYYANKARVLARRKAQYDADPETYNAKCKAYRKDNIETYRARERQASEKLRQESPDLVRERVARSLRKARQADPEKYRQLARARYWADPEKSRKRGTLDAMNRRARKMGIESRLSLADLEIMWGRQRGCCALCNEPLGDETPHKDHWIPLARGGAHSLDNLRLLHPTCNLRKWAKLPSEIVPQFLMQMENVHAS